MQKNNHYEIERRFLIRMPDMNMLESCASSSRISQTYLISGDGSTARVRMRAFAEKTEYTHTVKRRISAVIREENEKPISREEYESFLLFSDPKRKTIEKTRYCVDYLGKCFEIDIFPFYKDRAIIEIELNDEKEEFVLPPMVSVIKEITADKRYTNAAMALCIPWDDI